MNKEQAIKDFLQFKEECLLSRDKSIEVFTFFKYNPEEKDYTTLVNNAPIKIQRKYFWDILNTTDIRNIYKKPKPQSEKEILDEDATPTDYTKLRKECVTVKNKLNFERNLFNKKLKEISSLEELNQELINSLKKLKPIVSENGNYTQENSTDDVLVVHCGDWHLGELSSEFKDTGFDMSIASKRLKKYADYIKNEVISKGIKKVVIMCGGDICNNVTLLSKRLLQTSNRAVTTIMAVVLFQHFILDIYSVCKNIVFAGVGNNESRYDEDYFEDEYLITNCADYVVYNMLELLFKDFKTITFLNGRNCEKVVCINKNNNFLLTHGVTFGKGDVEKSVQQAISRYAVKGINIRYVLLSHIHCARNSSYFSRNGALCGGNAYSNSTLNLQTRASQNILFVSKNGDIQSVALDLENVDSVQGYDINNEIEKFNLKDRDKRIILDNIQFA